MLFSFMLLTNYVVYLYHEPHSLIGFFLLIRPALTVCVKIDTVFSSREIIDHVSHHSPACPVKPFVFVRARVPETVCNRSSGHICH